MVKVFLFIELLKSASPDAALAEMRKLELSPCTLAASVHLAEEKLVAQLNCERYEDATRAILEKIAAVKGVVQTNIVAAVRPVH